MNQLKVIWLFFWIFVCVIVQIGGDVEIIYEEAVGIITTFGTTGVSNSIFFLLNENYTTYEEKSI